MHTLARIVGAFLALTILLGQPAPMALAQGAPFCAPGAAPAFVQGFAQLKSILGDVMGDPVECEHTDGASGDVLQQTTTGLAFWRKSTNTATFTDGYRHWALTARGLLTWEGNSIDPPATARPAGGQPSGAPASGSGSVASGGRTESAAVSAIGAGRRRTPNEFVFRTIDQAPANNGWPCLSRNPSCGREEWWAQWNELQDSNWLQYKYIGAGLVTEARFAEAISLLWLWPEGRELLTTAANHGVAIYSSQEIARRAFAAYRPADRTLMVNPNFTEVSTWLLADVLAHELRHASDHATTTRMGGGYGDCVAREQAAFNTERDFVRWLAERQGGLPSSDEVSKLLSQEDFALFSDIYRTLNSPNLNAQVEESYRSICRGGR
ncbi:MAG: hypothetical protein IT306_22080 [Chloroflexi bacterium]|nr:hypothetical protein [Chloroflexota bacterium]